MKPVGCGFLVYTRWTPSTAFLSSRFLPFLLQVDWARMAAPTESIKMQWWMTKLGCWWRKRKKEWGKLISREEWREGFSASPCSCVSLFSLAQPRSPWVEANRTLKCLRKSSPPGKCSIFIVRTHTSLYKKLRHGRGIACLIALLLTWQWAPFHATRKNFTPPVHMGVMHGTGMGSGHNPVPRSS